MTAKAPSISIKGVLESMVSVLPTATQQNKLPLLERSLEDLNTREFFAFEAVEGKIEELEAKLKAEKVRLQMASLGYPQLDYSFLTWQKKESKMPAFMVLTLDSNEFSIIVEPNTSRAMDIENDVIWSIEPDLPEAVQWQYENSILAIARLSNRDYDDEEISVTAQFQGVMPSEVRTEVRRVLEAEIFDDIFVICEAPKWVVNKTGRTSLRDPLVVGWDEETDQMFLIASFDPTTLEKYVQDQFAL